MGDARARAADRQEDSPGRPGGPRSPSWAPERTATGEVSFIEKGEEVCPEALASPGPRCAGSKASDLAGPAGCGACGKQPPVEDRGEPREPCT